MASRLATWQRQPFGRLALLAFGCATSSLVATKGKATQPAAEDGAVMENRLKGGQMRCCCYCFYCIVVVAVEKLQLGS